MFGYFYYYDPTLIFALIGLVLSLLASARVNTVFNKYSRVMSRQGITGAMAAERILHSQGIYDVRIERVSGKLSDHYDPRSKVLRLSDSTYGDTSVAAIGVAAHECGHAVQHAKGYGPLAVRSALVPLANIGSSLGYILVIIGLLFTRNTGTMLITIGLIAFSCAVLFQIVTLPVEFNASSRALVMLEGQGILGSEEIKGSRKVLSAAAMTYVAAAATSILQLIRLIIIAGGRNRD
ncbi:MAG: zinc metallopeptidase [Lachnospiraceae bacterium]